MKTEASALAPDDQLLVVRCQLGERAAFDALVRRWAGPLHRYARRLTDDADLARDLTQEEKMLTSAAALIDEACGGAIKRLVDSGDISGKLGSSHVLFGLSGIAATRVLVVGLGEQKKLDGARFQRISTDAARVLKGLPIARATSFLAEIEVPGRDLQWKLRTAALATDHAAYKYTATFKSKDKPIAATASARTRVCRRLTAGAAVTDWTSATAIAARLLAATLMSELLATLPAEHLQSRVCWPGRRHRPH